jgi:CubicO group peptidase (beta-lactamase class C family)
MSNQISKTNCRFFLLASILILQFLFVPLAISAQVPDKAKLIAAADKVISEAAASQPDKAPGCAVGGSINGEIVFRKAFGMADLEFDIPITPDSIFESGSVAKQFTAAALVLLAIDGKLSIDDPVRKYIPELPDYGAPLTIRHILNHTAGVRDWGAVMGMTGVGRGERIVRQAYALHVITEQRHLDFTPGAEYSYSNSGYTLAATIVERVSGKGFPEFTKERIFEPIGMKDSSWRDDYERLVPRRVQAYSGEKKGPYKLSMPFMNVYGNGGMLTTIDDFLKWNAALDSDRWQTMVEMMETQGVLNDGSKTGYALGLGVGDYHGIKQVGHSGSTAGYSTYLVRYPERGLSLVALCNAPTNNPTGLVRKIVDDVFGPFPVPASPPVIKISAAELKKYTGIWVEERTHMPFTSTVDEKKGTLSFRGATLRPLGQDKFQVGEGETRVVFRFDGNGRRSSVIILRGTDEEKFAATDEWSPSAKDLEGIAGTWFSAEADANVDISLKNGKVSIRLESLEQLPLVPSYRDHFTVGPEPGTVVWVVRNAKGEITEFHIGTGRMRDLLFVKVR